MRHPLTLIEKQQTCRTCYFSWNPGRKLHCTFNPPAVDTDTGQALLPAVRPSHKCAQFRHIDADYPDTHTGPRHILPIYKDHFGDYCKIPLSSGKHVKVDPEDYPWLAQWRWTYRKMPRTIYAMRHPPGNIRGKKIIMHRVIADTPDHLVCDHINHNGLDNRKQNLRNCTTAQNRANSRSTRNSTSKYKGVSWHPAKKKWAAVISANSKINYLGYFKDEIDAAKAYDKAAVKHHKEFACLNFPDET